jgi:hypothetical protein
MWRLADGQHDSDQVYNWQDWCGAADAGAALLWRGQGRPAAAGA